MKRLIDYHLLDWKESADRKCLILRGARQVGKTFAARELGKSFKNFLEVNLETDSVAQEIFSRDLDIERICLQLSEHTGKPIDPGSTLLFIDEIQKVPNAILALRYFYEKLPHLHVISAGSLLDFAIEQVGVPVGRITQLYMYPLSFIEFLVALGKEGWVRMLLDNQKILKTFHKNLIDYVGYYIAIGGMPAAINAWRKKKSSRNVKKVHSNLIFGYKQDFGAYARKNQIKHLSLIFNNGLRQISQPFVYAKLGAYQKRELEPAMELIEKAGLLHQVFLSSGHGVPVGFQTNPKFFKVILLDVGLTQTLLGYDLSVWFTQPLKMFINKESIVESFVGQELLAYSDPILEGSLYYWQLAERGSQAEIDYLEQIDQHIIPIEVKAGSSARLKSMQLFLSEHPRSPYGIRFWAETQKKENSIHSFPLHAVVKPLLANRDYLQQALAHLIS